MIPDAESRYLFYQMDCVNSESERITEINFWREWDSKLQLVHRQASVLPLSYYWGATLGLYEKYVIIAHVNLKQQKYYYRRRLPPKNIKKR